MSIALGYAIVALEKALDPSTSLGFAVRACAAALAVAAASLTVVAHALSSAYDRLKSKRHVDIDGESAARFARAAAAR